MNRLLWESRRLVGSARAGICILLACAALALLVAFVLTARAERHLQEVRQTFAQHQVDWRNMPVVDQGGNALAQIYARFPSQSDVPKWLSSIFTAARDMNVDLELGEYSYAKERGIPLARYQIELPVIAPYPTVRALVASLMNKMPFAALDDFAITKELPEDEVVSATLRMSIFVRGDVH
jgi:hypothetical protein